jgi:hypothetical protein
MTESQYNGGVHCGCEVFHWKTPPQSKILGHPLADCRPRTRSHRLLEIVSEEKANFQQKPEEKHTEEGLRTTGVTA